MREKIGFSRNPNFFKAAKNYTMMDNFSTTQNQVVVALDIGTTKVCAIAGRKDEHGKSNVQHRI